MSNKMNEPKSPAAKQMVSPKPQVPTPTPQASQGKTIRNSEGNSPKLTTLKK